MQFGQDEIHVVASGIKKGTACTCALLAHVKRMRDFVKYDEGQTSQTEGDKGETN